MKTPQHIISLLMLATALSWSQYSFGQKYSHKQTIQNLRKFDDKKMHFGFNLGVNIGDFSLDHDLTINDSLVGLVTNRQPGFNIGTVADYHIFKELNLRFLFTLSFSQRDLEYTFLESSGTRRSVVKPIESTYLDFPLNLKWRSLRYNNFAAYLIGGGQYSLDLASKENVRNAVTGAGVVVKIKRHTFSYQAGVGFDFFLEYFKFGLEAKMTYGLGNIHVPDGTEFSDPITRINSKVFTISFLFEG